MHKAICTKVQGKTHIYDQTFWIFHFLCGFGFLHTQNKDIKVRSKQKQNNAYKDMHDAQMHDNEASNAWKSCKDWKN